MTGVSLSPGLRAELHRTVDDEATASSLGSGDVPVLGTPAVLALMERAACDALADALSAESTSVGTWAELHHIRPTKVGSKIVASAELTEVTDEGRVLHFTCEVREGDTVVANARHRRVVVNRERFLGRT